MRTSISCKLAQPLQKSTWEAPQKLKIIQHLTQLTAHGYSKNAKLTPQGDICTSVSTVALCTIAVESAEEFNNRGRREMWSIFNEKRKQRDWIILTWIKCSPCKREDLSLNPRTHGKPLKVAVSNSSAPKAEAGEHPALKTLSQAGQREVRLTDNLASHAVAHTFLHIPTHKHAYLTCPLFLKRLKLGGPLYTRTETARNGGTHLQSPHSGGRE